MATRTDKTTIPVLPSSWDLVKPSFQLVRANIDTLIWLVLIPGILVSLGGIMANTIIKTRLDVVAEHATTAEITQAFHEIAGSFAHTTRGQLAIALIIISLLYKMVVYPATVAFAVHGVQGKPADTPSCLRAGFANFWRLYGLAILMFIIIGVGLVLFIIPGLIFIRRYILAPYYLLDRNLSIRESLKVSAKETKRFRGYVWGTLGVMIAFQFFGSACNAFPYIGGVLGLLVISVFYFGLALRYKTISAAT